MGLRATRPQQIQVRVAASGINFIDVYQREGIYPLPTPFVLGSEGAGEVTAVGSAVTGIEVGEKVAWASQPGSHATFVNIAGRFGRHRAGGSPARGGGGGDAAGNDRALPGQLHLPRAAG